MTDQFAFLGDTRKAAIVAMSLGILLLLPASLGYGGTIIQEAFAQFNLPLLEEDDTEETEEEDGDLVVEEEDTPATTTTTPPPATTTTTPPPATTTTTDIPDAATYMLSGVNTDALRGFIGSTLPAQGADGNAAPTAEDDSGHVATGRFRLFANDTLVRRFVAEMNVAAIDGSSFHNITITEGAPHRFEVTPGNQTTGATQAVSPIVGQIFLNGGPAPVIDNVPMTISVRGQSLALENIDIDETRITDPGQQDAISAIDGQTIYGTIPR
jgi:cytoskeletal protein RodZ